jgi:hypothetical protein
MSTDTVDKLEEIRDRVLAGWKVAKRAESKQRIKEALDKFIRHFFEVTELTNEPEQSSNTTQSKFDTPQTETTITSQNVGKCQ